MPREITVTLYQFDELPTEEAKENARDWMRHRIANDPFWVHEYRQSWEAAADVFREIPGDLKGVRLFKWIHNNLDAKLYDGKGSCPLTGFSADHDMLQPLEDFMKRPDLHLSGLDLYDEADQNSGAAWERELEWQLEDEQVDDHIIANEYEFTADGSQA